MFLYLRLLFVLIGVMVSSSTLSVDLTIVNDGYYANIVHLYLQKSCCCFWSSEIFVSDSVEGEKVFTVEDEISSVRLVVVGRHDTYDLGTFSFRDKQRGGVITMEYEDGDRWSSSSENMEKK